MATITTIQGTDSLSASRNTLNNNFDAINDEVNLLSGILDPNTGNLTGGSATVSDMTIAGGASATFTSVLNTLSADTTVDGLSTFNGGVVYDIESIGVAGLPGVLGFESSTYVIDALTAPTVNVDQALPGQEITLIANGGSVSIANPLDVAGVTASIDIAQYGTLTLRYVGSSWYVIGSFLTTIV